jgi:hypothetical protein
MMEKTTADKRLTYYNQTETSDSETRLMDDDQAAEHPPHYRNEDDGETNEPRI